MKNKNIDITSIGQIERLISYIEKTGYASIDFETNGMPINHPEFKPTILGFSFQPGISYVLPLAHGESCFKKDWLTVLKMFDERVFSNLNIVKVAWNLKFEQKILMHYGITLRGRLFDAMLAKYMLDETRPNDLKDMVRRFIPEFSSYEDAVDVIARKVGWGNVPIKTLSPYCGLDCDLTLRLMYFFEPKLIKSKLYKLYRNLLMQASTVLAKSEYNGYCVDVPFLDKLVKEYAKKIELNELKLRKHKALRRFEKRQKRARIQLAIDDLQEDIDQIKKEKKGNWQRLISTRQEKISKLIAGEFTTNKDRKLDEPFNFNSPPQVREFFFTRKGLGLPILKRTDSNEPSTDEETLLKLKKYDDSGLIDELLKHRELSKLYSTYIVGIKEKVTPDNKLHATYLIHGTVTGRLSCVAPNIQNIPRGTTAADIKKFFIAPKGYVILQLDYAQAELRVMAEMANETSMIEAFRKGHDIHTATACKKYKVDYEIVAKILKDEKHKDYTTWSKRRKQAKTINFGIIYCQGAPALAESLSEPAKDGKPAIIVTKEEAAQFLREFDETFPRVARFIKNQQKKAYEKGYVKTLFGRKRRLPDLYLPLVTRMSKDGREFKAKHGLTMEAERQAVNAPVQGTATDYALFSSVLIDELLSNKEYKHWGCHQVYTVHDSIGFYIKPQYVHEAVALFDKIVQNPQTKKYFGFEMTKVKMLADFEVGVNWKELEKYKKENDYKTKFKLAA